VKLKDYSWSLAIENYLKGEMRTFFCDNFEDGKRLDDMAKQYLGNRISCVVSRFMDRPFDTSSARAIPSQVCFVEQFSQRSLTLLIFYS
jgi:hypothetical protein